MSPHSLPESRQQICSHDCQPWVSSRPTVPAQQSKSNDHISKFGINGKVYDVANQVWSNDPDIFGSRVSSNIRPSLSHATAMSNQADTFVLHFKKSRPPRFLALF